MKIALMILFVWGGFTITTVSAQNCTPCPPACCKVATCELGKSSAGVNQSTTVQNALVAYSPEMVATCSPGQKMSKKEIKECQLACQPVCAPASEAKGQPVAKPVAVQQVSTSPSKPMKQ